jgi:hypothetical protein
MCHSDTRAISAWVGIDWADNKHDIVLRPWADPTKSVHRVIENKPEVIADWIIELQQRFGSQGKVIVALEQSRGALLYQLMNYEFLELYPINPSQLANYRKTFFSSGAKDDRDRLKALKPDDALTRTRRVALKLPEDVVDRRTRGESDRFEPSLGLLGQIGSGSKSFFHLLA